MRDDAERYYLKEGTRGPVPNPLKQFEPSYVAGTKRLREPIDEHPKADARGNGAANELEETPDHDRLVAS